MQSTRMVTGMSIVLAILAGASWAAPATPPADRDKIARLVEQLESGSPRERESAVEQLEAIGEPALDRLRSSAKSLHPKAAARAMKVVEAIGRRARDAKLLAPTMVELDLENVTVDEALAELSKQSGYEVVRSKSAKGDRRVTLKTGRVSFLRAMELFQERAGMLERPEKVELVLPDDVGREVRPLSERNYSWIVPPGFVYPKDTSATRPLSEFPAPRSTFVCEEGKSATVASHAEGAVRVRVGESLLSPADAIRAGSPLFLRVDAEPKVTIVGVVGVRIDRAVDNLGNRRTRSFAGDDRNPIAEWDPRATLQTRALRHLESRVQPMNRDPGLLYWPLAFQPGEGVATTLREVTGVVRVNVAVPLPDLADFDHLTARDIREGPIATGGRVDLSSFTRNSNGTFSVTIRKTIKITGDEYEGPIWDFSPATLLVRGRPVKVACLLETPRLFDERGAEMHAVVPGYGLGVHDQGVMTHTTTMTYRPGDSTSKPARFVLSGAGVETIEVPFVLRNVPIHDVPLK